MSLLNRRPTTRPARVLTASGQKIDLTSKAKPRKTEQWQADAWHYRNTVGEIRYAIGFKSHLASRVRLIPALAQPDGEPPTPLDEAEGVPPDVLAAATDALARLTGGTYNYAELLRPYAENLEVPGECYLVGHVDDDDAEVWEVRSVSEVTQGDRGWKLADSPGDKNGRDLPSETSFVARLWNQHPQWKALADSPMRSLIDACEELVLVSRLIRRASKNRLAANGILFIDDALDFSAGTAAVADSDDPESDPWMTEFVKTIVAPVADEGDAASLVPIVLRGTLPDGRTPESVLYHLSLSDNVPEGLLNRLEQALKRIAMGLDVPPEIMTGVAEVNHWSAWQIDDSTIRNHVEPLVIRMCDGLTAAYLRSALAGAGVDPSWARRIVTWYDVGPLTVRPNRSQDAKDGHASGVLSDRVLAESLGFDPEADMPSEDELMRRLALQRGAMDGSLTEWLLRWILPQLDNVRHLPPGQVTVHNGQDAQDAEAAKPPTVPVLPGGPVPDPAADPPADEPAPDDGGGETPGPTTGVTAAAAAGPVLTAHERESRRLSDIDRSLRERLSGAADAAVSRAVERASNRVRSQANKDPEARNIVSSVLPRQAAGALGEAMVAGLGLDPETLLAGAWDDLQAQWEDWTAAAREQALELAARMAGHDPDDPAVARALEQASAQLAEQTQAAWPWLVAGLTAATMSALYDPDVPPQDVEPGEDPGRAGAVATLARGALALAGGVPARAGGVTSAGLPAQPGARLGGIATGDIVDTYLAGAGVQVIGYEWVYGISRKHFEPHRRLDGVMFTDFDSPALANPESWPSSTLAPGDHKGCHCDAQPVYADSASSAALDAVGAATYDPSYLNVLRRIAADDLAAGRTDTDAVATVQEADRVAGHRPSRRS